MSELETILNNITEALVITDPDGDILFFNELARENDPHLSSPLQIGKSLLDVVSGPRREIVRNILKEVARSKRRVVSEAEYKRSSGYSKYFEVSYNPILDASQQLDRICIVGHDITPQKTFEIKTQQLLRELKDLIDNANAIIFRVDTRGYITEWNNECVRLTGYDRSDVYAQRLWSLFDKRKTPELDSILDKIAQGQAMSNLEIDMQTKPGNLLTLLLNATPTVNTSGSIIGTLFVGQDITELSAYKKSLELKVRERTQQLMDAMEKERKLLETKNRLVAIASHEFRVPLTSIKAAVNYLQQHETVSDDSTERLQTIVRQANNMTSLLDNVLAGEKTTRQLTANLKPVELTSFLRTVIDEVAINANYSHKIVAQLPEEVISLQSDERLLRNIFINLLSNAIKFSPGKESVHVVVMPGNGNAQVRIRDFGIGILPVDMPTLFEPFVRGSNTEKIDGTGLGLSIVKKAIETLGGKLAVESEPGEGTTFTVHLKII